MKKLGIFMFVMLTFYCAFLTYQMNELKKGLSIGNQESVTYVNKTVTGFSTDLTKVIEQASEKIVHVDAFHASSSVSLSGVIYSYDDERTLIITNAHGIEGALTLAVTFANGESVNGTLLGVDALTDLAVISTHPSFAAEPIVLADTSVLSLGEWVIAVGSDVRQDTLPSISVGVLSGKNRMCKMSSSLKIQDDLAVMAADLSMDEGISGGAVINMQSEMIGMPSSSLSETGQCVIVPAEEVEEVVRMIVENGKAERPVLGISTLPVAEMTAYEKSQLGIQLDQISGLYVKSTAHGGPSDAAGILTGDIVLEINGSQLLNYNSLREVLYAQKSQTQIELTVLRGTDQMKVLVTLE